MNILIAARSRPSLALQLIMLTTGEQTRAPIEVVDRYINLNRRRVDRYGMWVLWLIHVSIQNGPKGAMGSRSIGTPLDRDIAYETKTYVKLV